MKKELNTKKFFNAMAFIALVIAGIVLVVSKILGAVGIDIKILSILNTVASTLAFVVTSVAAYYYVRTKRSIAWMIVYVIAVILVVVPLVLSLF